MVCRTLVAFIFIALISIAGAHAQEPDTKDARTAVNSWLILIDTSNYAKSWDEAATFFKSAVPSEKWQAAVKSARTPFGALKSRTAKSAAPVTNPPGAP